MLCGGDGSDLSVGCCGLMLVPLFSGSDEDRSMWFVLLQPVDVDGISLSCWNHSN